MLVARRIVIQIVSLEFDTQSTGKMSSCKTNCSVAKILCVVYIISLVGSRSAVNGGVVIPGSSLSNNRPSSLVSAATNLYTQTQNGQISQAEAHRQSQYLIQANRDKVNLALIHGIGGK